MIACMLTIAAAWLGLACLIVLFLACAPRPTNALRTGSPWEAAEAADYEQRAEALKERLR